MTPQYVEMIEGAYRIAAYRIAGTRVSLDSVVYAYRNGLTAEGLAQSFPALTLEQVHGALAYYLANQPEIDAYLASSLANYNALRDESRRKDPMFYQKLAEAERAKQAAAQ
jgi:uncharacterized protein (DUF433 family)